MRISWALFVILLAVSAIGVSRFAYSGWQSWTDFQRVDTLSTLNQHSSTWMDGTVALSLERSVTQVALSSDTPIAEAFRALIDEQRALSDRLFDEAIAAVAALNGLPTRHTFVQTAQAARRDIEALRQEADAMLAVGAAGRDPARRSAVPAAIKRAVVTLRNASEFLRLESRVMSHRSNVLRLAQNRAWEIREFGGRARTYYAIAALRGEATSAQARAAIAEDEARADEAWAAIQNAFATIDVPRALESQAAQAGRLYFGGYRETLRAMNVAMADAASQRPVQYAMSFDAFFAHSNEALDGMVALSRAAGAANADYWRERRTEAWFNMAANVIASLALLVVVALSLAFVRRRIVGRLEHVTDVLVAASKGDRDAAVAARNDDCVEIATLASALDQFRAAQTEADAAKADAEARAASARLSAMRQLGEKFGDVVESAVAGDFSRRAASDFDDDALNALAAGMNRLLQSTGANLDATRDAVRRVVDGDLNHSLRGDFHGAFDEMRRDVNEMIDQFSTLIERIRNTAADVRSDADDISARARESADSAHAQVAKLASSTDGLDA